MTDDDSSVQPVQSTDLPDKQELHVDIQIALTDTLVGEKVPSECQLEQWARLAYYHVNSRKSLSDNNEVTLRLVDAAEIQELNERYRGKNKPTNVLSFPFEVPEGVDMELLGDIVICHQVVIAEAESQGKSAYQHYAHMVTHGILHLCGYDHQEPGEADEMESLEIDILSSIDLPNPYTI